MSTIDLSKLSIVADFNLVNSLIAMVEVYPILEDKDIPRIEQYIQSKFVDQELLEIGMQIVQDKKENMSGAEIKERADKSLNDYMDKKDREREARAQA